VILGFYKVLSRVFVILLLYFAEIFSVWGFGFLFVECAKGGLFISRMW